jgi:hypothetical protein
MQLNYSYNFPELVSEPAGSITQFCSRVMMICLPDWDLSIRWREKTNTTGIRAVHTEVRGPQKPFLLVMKEYRFPKLKYFNFFIPAATILLLVFSLVGCNSNNPAFQFVDGEKAAVVLIRNTDNGSYQVQYNGDQPAQIHSLQVMIAGQILHVDVANVNLRLGEQAVSLIDNNVPEGESFVVQPGETFTIDVSYSGQSLGFNYVHGFRMTYTANGQTSTLDVTDPELPDYQYLIDVE